MKKYYPTTSKLIQQIVRFHPPTLETRVESVPSVKHQGQSVKIAIVAEPAAFGHLCNTRMVTPGHTWSQTHFHVHPASEGTQTRRHVVARANRQRRHRRFPRSVGHATSPGDRTGGVVADDVGNYERT